SELYGTQEALLASYADEALLQSGGSVTIPGMYMEEMFLADMLRWIGVEPDFVQVGDYKGASEMLANSSPSPAWEENISQLLDSLYGTMVRALRTGRDMDRNAVERALTECFFADGARAIRVGMIDAEIDRLDLRTHLEDFYGDTVTYDTNVWKTNADMPDFASMGMFEAFGTMMRMLSETGPRATTRDTIAIVHIDGAIVDGESSSSFLGTSTVGALTMRKTLKKIEDDDNIKAVIVRIESPGGSATASENIWRGLQRVREAGKPVWVSVGSMAASGGYYIAVAGERIYVSPSSIVGSIGVVGGKLAMEGLFDKLRINVVPRTRGPRASMMSGLTPWEDEQRDLIRQRMTETYDLFVKRVQAGRDRIDIDRTAEGRLFTGDRAVDLRMADAVGGLQLALADLAEETGLLDGEFDVMDYPAPKSFEEVIEEMFGVRGPGGAQADAMLGAVRAAVGEDAWRQMQDPLRAMFEMRDQPVLLTMPRALIFR
ncbi:MAG: signal peptide peptidase SppA, partial [Planctomycetota bacterium]